MLLVSNEYFCPTWVINSRQCTENIKHLNFELVRIMASQKDKFNLNACRIVVDRLSILYLMELYHWGILHQERISSVFQSTNQGSLSDWKKPKLRLQYKTLTSVYSLPLLIDERQSA